MKLRISIFMVGFGICFVAICFSSFIAGGDIFPSWKTRHITGIVSGDVNSRFITDSDGNGEEKFALRLKEVIGDMPSGVDVTNEVFVDCLSTRCGVLREGDIVNLYCGYEGRFGRSDVMVCDLE